MAKEAAAKMKEMAYAKKIDAASEKIDQAIEKLVRVYVPAPVIACTNEYDTYIGYCTVASITTITEHNGWSRREGAIIGKLTFKLPTNSRHITVSNDEYQALRKLQDKKKAIVNESEDLEMRVLDALVALGSEKNVERELPEAMKYIVFPPVKAVPMPVFKGLRDILGKIKED